jgi:ABC-type spermidine/putrescine transport system permease subunit II
MTFALGQLVMTRHGSPLVRSIVVLAFAVPAVIAGYTMILQFSELGVASLAWRHIIAVVGAATIGCTVISRLMPQSLSTPRT